MGVKAPKRAYQVVDVVERKAKPKERIIEKTIEKIVEKPVIKEVEKIVKVDDPALLEKLNAALKENAELKRFIREPEIRIIEKPIERIVDKFIEVKEPMWIKSAIGLGAFVAGVLIGWGLL